VLLHRLKFYNTWLRSQVIVGLVKRRIDMIYRELLRVTATDFSRHDFAAHPTAATWNRKALKKWCSEERSKAFFTLETPCTHHDDDVQSQSLSLFWSPTSPYSPLCFLDRSRPPISMPGFSCMAGPKPFILQPVRTDFRLSRTYNQLPWGFWNGIYLHPTARGER
jgi:hypothetical protein